MARKQHDQAGPVRLRMVTDEDVKRAKDALYNFNWLEKKKRSHTARVLEQLRPEIEQARKIGVSWPAITEEINGRLGTRVHPATVRSYFSGQKLTDKDHKESKGSAFDLSGERQDQNHAARPTTPTTSPVSGS